MNEMSLDAAAANLQSHGLTALRGSIRDTPGVRGYRKRSIARRLEQGQVLETRWATFRLAR